MNKCPKCNSENIIGVQYIFTSQDYDGISEYKCSDCNYRQGRWSEIELEEGFIEKRYGGKPIKI